MRSTGFLLGELGHVRCDRAGEHDARLARIERHRQPAEGGERASGWLGGFADESGGEVHLCGGELGTGFDQPDAGLVRELAKSFRSPLRSLYVSTRQTSAD